MGAARQKGYPLDEYCRKLEEYSLDNLLKADVKKAAKKYGISEKHAAGYLRLELQRRGAEHMRI